MDTKREVKPIQCLNDYVAIAMDPLSTVLEVQDNNKKKHKCVGTIVGISPELPKGLFELGDRVVVRENTYLSLTPEQGCYSECTIVMVRKPDLVLKQSRLPEHPVFEFKE